MKAREFRNMEVEQIKTEIRNMKESLFKFRFQHFTGQLENPMKLRNTRRDLARAYSVLKEKLSSKTSSEKNK
ncbi:MAG: 50S ribosomal protein L29 [Myxococcota bacterium]